MLDGKDALKQVDFTFEAEALDAQPPPGYETRHLGVWQMVFGEKVNSSVWGFLGRKELAIAKDVAKALPYGRRFLTDIVRLDPVKMLGVLISGALVGAAPSISLYLTNELMSTIEIGVSTGKMDTAKIQRALVGRLLADLTSRILGRLNGHLERSMNNRISQFYQHQFMQASLSKPFSEFEATNAGDSKPHHEAVSIYAQMREFFQNVVSILSALSLLIQLGRSSNVGILFLVLSVLRTLPILDGGSSLWMRGCVYWAINTSYRRMQSMRKLIEGKEFRQEIVSAGLEPFIIDSYSKARENLVNVDLGHARQVLRHADRNMFTSSLMGLVDDWPTLYYAIYAMRGAIPFRFSAISSLQSSSTDLQWRVKFMFGYNNGSLSQTLLTIKDIYQALEPSPDLTADALVYPGEHTSQDGMKLELRNITFTYPGSRSEKPAIENVSCTIGAGQLVVIVGENGSGKTSLVKLLTRLYDPSSGEILVDGKPTGAYRVRDLRKATALLSQDHALFPLSVSENIGIGWPSSTESKSAINEAARKGGSRHFISKLTKGYDTILDMVQTKGIYYLPQSHPLQKFYHKLEKSAEVSGGERQRLVASRTFMRIDNGNMKLVVVDEPSAAMDPTGEYELFRQLREARDGKTMIFITHRFGHLTKHADLILCMKDGNLVESGTHQELIAMNGEYYKLYNVQAQAFTS